MRLSLAFVAFAIALPAFAKNISPRIGTVIPLTKRATLVRGGAVNRDALQTVGAKTSTKLNNAFKAYEQNTRKRHPFAMRASATPPGNIRGRDAGSGADPLTATLDSSLWFGSIAVGTPPVNFTVHFNTVSTDFFLPGLNCTTSCDGHRTYNTSASSTAKNLDQPFVFTYVDGSTTEGNVFTDTVTVAGLTVTNQSVGAASQYSPYFAPNLFPADGFMGMGFSQVSSFGTQPFFQHLVAESGAIVPQFSFKLAGNDSELFLGGANSELFVGEFTTLNVMLDGFWLVALDSVTVGNNTLDSDVPALIDIATPFLIGPEEYVAKIYQEIPGAQNVSSTLGEGIFTIPCDSNPEVSLTFGGKQFQLASFNLGPVEEGSSECVGGIAFLSTVRIWVVGDIFLSGVYTRFDTGAKQVGFANLA